MANKNQVTGQLTATVDGQRLATSGETTMMIGGKSRENVAGDYDAASFKETTVPSRTEITVLNKNGTNLSAMRDWDNVTLVLQTDIGKTWIVRNGYTVEPPDFGQDGKAKVIIEGPPAEEMV